MIPLAFISFLAPALAIAGGAAVALPIAIHLLSRRHRKPVTWGAMRFLLAAYRQQRRRLQLEQMLLLALRCLLVLLLGLALAGPLLSGCTGRALQGVQQPGRTIWLVFDNSLASQTLVAHGQMRFDQQLEQARKMVAEMGPNDRMAIVPLVSPGSDASDHPITKSPHHQIPSLTPAPQGAALSAELDQLQPRYSRPQWTPVFERIAQRLERDAQTGAGAGEQRMVVVLSGLAADESLFGPAHQRAAERISQHAALYLPNPLPAAVNVQIQKIAPARPSVLVASGDAGEAASLVPVNVTLRRFGGVSQPLDARLTVVLRSPTGQADNDQSQTVRFEAGQSTLSTTLQLPAPLADPDQPNARAVWTFDARVTAPSGQDSLAADDKAQAVVELRDRLHVMLIDNPLPVASRLTPGRWVELALGVTANVNGGDKTHSIALAAARPDELDNADLLRQTDAVLLMRPDMIDKTGWASLQQFVTQGGVLLTFPPADQATTAWYGPMREALGVDWQVALDVQQADAAAGDVSAEKLPGVPGAGVQLAQPEPEGLSLLGSELAELVRGVRVKRWIDIAPAGGTPWLLMTRANGENTGEVKLQQPQWLTTMVVGDGDVALFGSALDLSWSNLPTRPLFVPLLNETLRSLTGGNVGDALVQVTASQRATLGESWRGVTVLVKEEFSGAGEKASGGSGASGGGGGSADEGGPSSAALGEVVTVRVRPLPGAGGSETVEPLFVPGVYRPGEAERVNQRVVVSLDADAGNTEASPAQAFGRWVQATGATARPVGDATLPAVAATGPGASLAWPLLWALLAVALAETLAARWVSHATVAQRDGLGKRVWTSVRRTGVARKSADAAKPSSAVSGGTSGGTFGGTSGGDHA